MYTGRMHGKRENVMEKHPQPIPEDGVEIDYQQLEPATFENLVKEFVLREGTDYGAVEALLPTKVSQVKKQIERGDLKIVFDLASETNSIVPKR